MTGPIVDRVTDEDVGQTLPPTWCVVECMQGCDESWTVDVEDFWPPLTADAVERMLTPLLAAHEVEHGKW